MKQAFQLAAADESSPGESPSARSSSPPGGTGQDCALRAPPTPSTVPSPEPARKKLRYGVFLDPTPARPKADKPVVSAAAVRAPAPRGSLADVDSPSLRLAGVPSLSVDLCFSLGVRKPLAPLPAARLWVWRTLWSWVCNSAWQTLSERPWT